MIPADVAAWIRDTVLTAGYLAATPDPTRCPCQGGPSGHCGNGNCGQCPRTQEWHRHGQPDPETYIVSSNHHAALTPVWRAGRACRWLCDCTCHTTVTPLFAAPARTAGRRTGAHRIASTDRALADHTPQPSLMELL
ncbi:DUF6248 family natural product biosynthesis protein [Micromonospora sp. S-DT3-3-22]|uniref:DUF6248 family natural product biosynthesis protein n=1 Tax=Micromonospora sp. S-DT3-3-22 TaxID=2755359 RepID=UPI00188F97F1|nr:DUF6248 family natural product biosynthesis protein [Micromonospora sp. S-DT3-3-22]